jgi:L-amino acid N-acyltransferase YncA
MGHDASSDILIRAASAADIPAVTAIYRPAVLHGTASFEIDPPDEAEMLARMTRIVEDGFPYLVAQTKGRVVGYAYAGPYRVRPAYRHTVEDSIYVAPDAQGLGVGRALLAALVDEAGRRGFRQIVAGIGDSANTPSIRLHEAAGFRLSGVMRSVGWKHGRWLDHVLMQRTLGEGEASPPAR